MAKGMLSRSYWLFRKDVASEIRTRYAINALIMFILVTISIVLFSLANTQINYTIASGLYWITIYYTATNGLARSFVSEQDRGTHLILKLVSSPDVVLTGKLLFNTALTFSFTTVITLFYLLWFESFKINSLVVFILLLILSNIGLAAASTILAALISKAGAKNSLFAVLSFPVLLPLLLVSVEITKECISGTSPGSAYSSLGLLICYDGIVITAAYMLFGFVWED